MKKRSAVIAVVILACLTAGLFLFYRMDGHEANVRGEWMSVTDVVLFRKDGSCSTSFSHRPEWWDSVDRTRSNVTERCI